MKNIINCSCARYSDISTITHSAKYPLIIVIEKIPQNIEISFFSISRTPSLIRISQIPSFLCHTDSSFTPRRPHLWWSTTSSWPLIWRTESSSSTESHPETVTPMRTHFICSDNVSIPCQMSLNVQMHRKDNYNVSNIQS